MFNKIVSFATRQIREASAQTVIELNDADIGSVSGGCTESAGVCRDTGNGHIVCEGAKICASK